jgi:glycosyltransferase involved in cell wall biosynthesis
VGKSSEVPTRGSRVALVHDFLLDIRGGERVFSELCRMWPQAEIYTAIYDEDGTEGRFSDRTVHASFLQHLRPSSSNFRALLPLYPSAIRSFDLSGYDLVVSSSSAWAHAVVCSEATVHVSYCHNPFRYAWNDRDSTLARRNPLAQSLLRAFFARWREWDRRAARRVDRYVSNSITTQTRVRAYFGRESAIVHPSVELGRFSPAPVGDYYVAVSELMAHKQLDVAVAAFNALALPLVIVGDGPDARRLHHLAGPTIRFAGRLTDEGVARVLRHARAMVMTSVEEFGIAAVESQAAGRPVIARSGGGALETILDGVTGRLWSGGPDALAAAVLEFDDAAVDPQACVQQATRFSAERFRQGLMREIAIAYAGRLLPDLTEAQPSGQGPGHAVPVREI